VVPVEQTRIDASGQVVVDGTIAAGQHIGRRAADLAIGTRVVARGQVLTPSRIGALAATGHRTVEVLARPSVAIVSTGNEVVQPGLPLAPGQLYDINRFTLDAVTRRHGGWPVALASPKDTLDDLRRILGVAMAHDLIVFSGGSSVGDRDLVRDVIHERGTMLFHGIAVKPGKPTACATLAAADGRTVIFLGMPGNPTSCLSNAYILLIPVLRKMAGLPPWEPQTATVPLARPIRSASDRHQFYTVRLVTLDGQVMAEPAFKGSGDITSMANADGYVEIPASTVSIEAGTMVQVTLF
jgi:molybdenum cofactor synthesis domain-containing protein